MRGSEDMLGEMAFWRDPVRLRDVGLIAFLIVWSVGGVTLLHGRPELCALAMGFGLALAVWRWRSSMEIMLAFTGLLFGGLLEYAATTTGTWTYPHTSVGTLPAWVFTLWPLFPICLVRLVMALLPGRGKSQLGPLAEMGLGAGIILVEIPVLTTLGTERGAEAAVITAMMLVAAAWVARSPQALLMLALSGVVGPLCESLPVAMGAWSYPAPALLGMPAWLPTGYALFGFGLVRFALGLDALALRAPVLARDA